MDEWDLATAIATLRANLGAALAEGEGSPVKFGLGDIELTMQLVVTKTGGGKLGWSLLGAEASYNSANTHTLKLQLQPNFRQPDRSYTRDGLISSQTAVVPDFAHDSLDDSNDDPHGRGPRKQ